MYQAVEFTDAAKERLERAAWVERSKRIGAFIGLSHRAGSLSLLPMTPRIALRLEFAENRFVTGGTIDDTDIAHAVIELCPDAANAKGRKLKRIIQRFINSEHLITRISDHIRQGFEDLPRGGSGKTKGIGEPECWFSFICDRLCSDYGWTVEQCLDTPLAVIWQLIQAGNKRQLGKKYMMSNPITQQARSNELKRAIANMEKGAA
jgi:hypothetical protein